MIGVLSALPKLWPIIKNIGLVLDFFQVVKKIFGDVSARPTKMINCEEGKLLIEQTRKLLDSGIIDVPGVDEKEIAGVLLQIEERLVCTIEKSDKSAAALQAAVAMEKKVGV